MNQHPSQRSLLSLNSAIQDLRVQQAGLQALLARRDLRQQERQVLRGLARRVSQDLQEQERSLVQQDRPDEPGRRDRP